MPELISVYWTLINVQGYTSPDSELKKELQRKDALIARLIAESK